MATYAWRGWALAVVFFAGIAAPDRAWCQSAGFVIQRPFVIAVIPVTGRNGAVGGVSIDSDGVLKRAGNAERLALHDARTAQPVIQASLTTGSTRLRKISLKRLDAALAERMESGESLTEELAYLAGLQSIQYVMVYPDQNDIVLAGKAEPWRVTADGDVVGSTTGDPVLRLDDLIVAMRAARRPSGRLIHCSIDPTDEGVERLQQMMSSGKLRGSRRTLSNLERTLGVQEISVGGVSPKTHFARILVAADFMMKRLAMGLEPSPVDDLPSYLELVRTATSLPPETALPRWWMVPRVAAIHKSPDGLAWELDRVSVEARSEDRDLGGRVNPERQGLTDQWASNFTQRYGEVARDVPVFGQLRGCMQLSIVASLIAREKLAATAGFAPKTLWDELRVQLGDYAVPKTVDSTASFVKRGTDWIISLSGGVEIDALGSLTSAVPKVLTDERRRASPIVSTHWWWD